MSLFIVSFFFGKRSKFSMSNLELHEETQQNLARVDQQLDALVEIAGTTKVLAAQIGTELTDQNQMIAQTNAHMDHTNNEVNKAVVATQKLKPSASSWFAWILTIILIVANVLVWVLIK